MASRVQARLVPVESRMGEVEQQTKAELLAVLEHGGSWCWNPLESCESQGILH